MHARPATLLLLPPPQYTRLAWTLAEGVHVAVGVFNLFSAAKKPAPRNVAKDTLQPVQVRARGVCVCVVVGGRGGKKRHPIPSCPPPRPPAPPQSITRYLDVATGARLETHQMLRYSERGGWGGHWHWGSSAQTPAPPPPPLPRPALHRRSRLWGQARRLHGGRGQRYESARGAPEHIPLRPPRMPRTLTHPQRVSSGDGRGLRLVGFKPLSAIKE